MSVLPLVSLPDTLHHYNLFCPTDTFIQDLYYASIWARVCTLSDYRWPSWQRSGTALCCMLIGCCPPVAPPRVYVHTPTVANQSRAGILVTSCPECPPHRPWSEIECLYCAAAAVVTASCGPWVWRRQRAPPSICLSPAGVGSAAGPAAPPSHPWTPDHHWRQHGQYHTLWWHIEAGHASGETENYHRVSMIKLMSIHSFQ